MNERTISITRAVAVGALLTTVATLASCSGAEAPRPRDARHLEPSLARPIALAPSDERADAVVLITLDGVRWQDVCHGVEAERAKRSGLPDARVVDAPTLLPNLYRLAARGTMIGATPGGDRIDATGPQFISLPGYWELLTGRRPASCRTNHCSPTLESTLIDEVAGTPGTRREDVAVFSSWERIERAAAAEPGAVVMSTGRHGGQDASQIAWDEWSRAMLARAAASDPWPGEDDYRPDAFTAALGLHYLETHAPRFFYLSLGDTDEHAHHDDYPRYLDALTFADRTLGRILDHLDAQGERGRRTVVVVTADHGRANDFKGHGGASTESGRVWLVAGGGGIAPAPHESGAQWYLADVAPTLRGLLGLRTDPSDDAGVAIAPLLDPSGSVASLAWRGAGVAATGR